MLRDRSSTEALLTYATFFAISVAIHLVVILYGRPRPAEPGERPQVSANDRPERPGR